MNKGFTTLMKNLKKDFSNHKTIKAAILGDSSTQFLAKSIRATGYEYGLDIQIWESDFNQIEQQIHIPNSKLYTFNPEIILISQTSHGLLNYFYENAEKQLSLFNSKLEEIESLITSINNNLKNSKILFFNFPEINDMVFGNYGSKIDSSFIYQIRKINIGLMDLSQRYSNLHVIDILSLQSRIGVDAMFKPSIYYYSEIWYNLDTLPQISALALDTVSAIYGMVNKCLILDLDNTIWGGVIGDDGIENIKIGNNGIGRAFRDLQQWAKSLKQRGIILAVCSKNNEEIAKEPFKNHPDMVLRLDDISVFIANWNNKADNIRDIQKILNIGFDSMVFLDDNPVERQIVKENLPEVTVPDLPKDPANYLPFLFTQNLFETASYSEFDNSRTKNYQDEAKRLVVKKNFVNENEFLKSLEMEAEIENFNAFNIPRVAQLTQRSNQFNLRTIRYNEVDISNIESSNKHYGLAYQLTDKFGKYGIISVVILKEINQDNVFIENWLMSCRVLNRGLEAFVLNSLVSLLKDRGYKKLIGEYLPTKKNGVVKDLYSNLGFKNEKKSWVLDLQAYKILNTHIKQKNG